MRGRLGNVEHVFASRLRTPPKKISSGGAREGCLKVGKVTTPSNLPGTGKLARPEVPAGGVDCDASAWIDSDILKDRGWR